MSNENQVLEAVQERDIDLLLLEELNCNPAFVDWFCGRLGLKGVKVAKARHSITHALLGETDIELTCKTTAGAVKVLIENKVDALLQPRQAERYRERGKECVNKGECISFKTAIAAPKKYLKQEIMKKFDDCLSYEEISAWLRTHGKDRERSNYKANLIEEAIEQARRGYVLIPHQGVTLFWNRYWTLANEIAPELEMREPLEKPASSSFVAFKPSALPKKTRIVHKLEYGHVDLELSGQVDAITEIKENLSPLPAKAIITKTGKSAAIRLKVRELETNQDFFNQESEAIKGINAAKKLLRWAEKNTEKIQKCLT